MSEHIRVLLLCGWFCVEDASMPKLTIRDYLETLKLSLLLTETFASG